MKNMPANNCLYNCGNLLMYGWVYGFSKQRKDTCLKCILQALLIVEVFVQLRKEPAKIFECIFIQSSNICYA